MGLFITFEGGEGCGKSTQTGILYRRLKKLAVPVLLTHEPGGTPLGEKITLLLKWSRQIAISPEAQVFLFNASRTQLVSDVIRPHLEKGGVIICDRYADSTTAYQHYGHGMDREMVESLNRMGTQDLIPDLTVLLDIPVEQGMARIKDKKPDRFETENIGFHRRVREGYLKMAKAGPERWLVVDAAGTKEEIAAVIWQKVSKLLPR